MGRAFFRPAHRDASEPAIIKALRAVGASVWPISGKDVPDLIVGYRGQTFLLEVKTRGKEYTDKRNGKTYKRDGVLSDGQKKFFEAWRGGKACEVFTPEEALYAIGAPVEGVLQPLRDYVKNVLEPEMERLTGPSLTGHLITPAFQKAETAAVVPPKRRRVKATAGEGVDGFQVFREPSGVKPKK